jgi:NTE family protein
VGASGRDRYGVARPRLTTVGTLPAVSTTRDKPSVRERARFDRRRRPRVAFVLSGGGNLGAIQVGMLRALVEQGITPDVVLGCSVGALNGATFADAPDESGVLRLEQHWRTTRSADLMPSSRIPSAVQLLRKGESLHSSDGLRSGVESLLGPGRRFEDLSVPFQCVAVEVESAIERWFATGFLTPAILASAALPAVFPPVTVDGRRYVDGGVVNNVPITRAVELGCREIYVLHVGPHGRPDQEVRRPVEGVLLAYWIARNSRFARDLSDLPDGVEAVILPPGRRPDLRYDDFDHTEELIEQGYANASAFLTERAAELQERRRATELLRPLERLMVSARNRSWYRDAERAATDPAGAVLSPPEPGEGGADRDDDEAAEGIDIDASPPDERADPGAPAAGG